MAAITFDTLKCVHILESKGIPRAQAEAHVQMVAEALGDQVATKQDIKELEAATRHDIKELAAATRHDLKELEARLETRIEATKVDLLRWLVTLTVIQIAAAILGRVLVR